MTRHIIFVFVIFFFAGCSIPQLSTKSGKPEITVIGVPKQKVVDGITAWSVSRGQNVYSTTDRGMITEGDMDIGLLFGKKAPVRIIYIITSNDSDLTVSAEQTAIVDDQVYEKGPDGNYNFTIAKTEKDLDSKGDLERIQSELNQILNLIIN